MKSTTIAIVYGAAFLTLLLPLLVADSMFFPYITGKNFAFRILVEIMLGGWVILSFLDAEYRPRFSWIAAAGGVLLIVMLFADLFGVYTPKSIWSNFERMDGYVTLVHFYLYFLIIASVFKKEKVWNYFFLTSIGAATCAALYGLNQYLGGVTGRIDATLGNSTYMAIYMLFNIAILGILLLRTKNRWLLLVGGADVLLFIYVLLQTGTRGTFIGLVGGTLVAVIYLALFARRYPEVRKLAVGSLAAAVLLGGVFYTVKDTDFIQSNPAMARYANINFQDDLQVRMTIWGMAYEGFKERPVLGWGQANFNYVFNKYYKPELYEQEAWFDRVHNIVFDWLIAGGLLGFLAYASIFLAILFYLFWRPLFVHNKNNEDSSFSVPERALLIGLFVGYLLHNLVVFDNLISYMFFGIVLALIHTRVSTPVASWQKFKVDNQVVSNVIAPTVVVLTMVIVYVVNVPGILAAQDIIDGLSTKDMNVRFDALERAYDRGSFADQEIVEQYSQQVLNLIVNTNTSPEVRQKYVDRASELLDKMIEKKPGDARLYVFAGSFYRAVGDLDKAREHIKIAHELSPNKQYIIMEQGLVELSAEDYQQMQKYFKQAYELDTSFTNPRVLYAASMLFTNQYDEAIKLIEDNNNFTEFAQNDMALNAAYQNGYPDLAIRMLKVRIDEDPAQIQNYINLTSVYYAQGNNKEAIATLNQAVEEIPSFATTAKCFIGNLEAGRDPNQGCQ